MKDKALKMLGIQFIMWMACSCVHVCLTVAGEKYMIPLVVGGGGLIVATIWYVSSQILNAKENGILVKKIVVAVKLFIIWSVQTFLFAKIILMLTNAGIWFGANEFIPGAIYFFLGIYLEVIGLLGLASYILYNMIKNGKRNNI